MAGASCVQLNFRLEEIVPTRHLSHLVQHRSKKECSGKTRFATLENGASFLEKTIGRAPTIDISDIPFEPGWLYTSRLPITNKDQSSRAMITLIISVLFFINFQDILGPPMSLSWPALGLSSFQVLQPSAQGIPDGTRKRAQWPRAVAKASTGSSMAGEGPAARVGISRDPLVDIRNFGGRRG